MADAGATQRDVSGPEEQEHVCKQQNDDVPASSLKSLNPKRKRGQTMETIRKTNRLSLWQLQALIVMVVLSASSLVGPQDMAFVVFAVIYIFLLSKFAFPNVAGDPSQEPPVSDPESNMARLGPVFGALIGILLPVVYLFDGLLEDDKEGIRAAAPHVFLLASQVFVDALAFSDRFSAPIRGFVPVFFNSMRIFTLVDWVRNEVSKGHGDYHGSGSAAAARRLYLGRALAIANLVFWTFHLLGFLLPVYLPRAFKKYYSIKKRMNNQYIVDECIRVRMIDTVALCIVLVYFDMMKDELCA